MSKTPFFTFLPHLSGKMPILRTKSPRRHCAFRAGWAADSCAGGYNFPFRAEKDTSFPRRTVPRSTPGEFGGRIPRRRLQFSFPRRKRYLIPAQNGATEQSGRIWGHFPAQAATIFHSAPKKIPYSRAERCHGAARADLGAFSRAEQSYIATRADLATESRAGGWQMVAEWCHGASGSGKTGKLCGQEVADAVFFG